MVSEGKKKKKVGIHKYFLIVVFLQNCSALLERTEPKREKEATEERVSSSFRQKVMILEVEQGENTLLFVNSSPAMDPSLRSQEGL